MDIRFSDHASFHKAALGMVGCALLFGLALHTVSPMAGGLLGIAAGASIAHGRAGWRMAASIAAVVMLLVLDASWPVRGAVAALVSLGLALGGPRGVKGGIGVVLSAATALIAMWCATRISTAQETVMWPAWITATTAAAAMGMVGVLAMLPRHVKLSLDPVAAAVRALPAGLDAEVKGLCDRSVAIWNTTKAKLADDDAGKGLVRDGVLKTIEVAAKSAEVKLAGDTDATLVARMEDFDRRIAAATDTEVKAQYQAARGALDDQRRYRERIRQGRERLVARMHNHVTTLEKFQLAATGLEAQAAAATPATKQLDELSQDVAASGEALAELELGVTASVSAG